MLRWLLGLRLSLGSKHLGPRLGVLKLSHHGIEDLIHTYSRCRALIVSPFVEELFQERRNELCLNPIIVNFPWTRAGEESHASCAGPQRQMHWQTITANQAAVVSDIGQMLEQRCPFRQHIDDQTLILKPPDQFPVVSPSFHWPYRAGVGCYRHIS